MKLRLLIVSLLVVGSLFAVTEDVHAGCCRIAVDNSCVSEEGLNLGLDGSPYTACQNMGGSYNPSCTCSAGGTTENAGRDTNRCCIFAQGSCEAPYVSGQCPEYAGLQSVEQVNQKCDSLFQCTGKGHPPITVAKPSIIKFTPQIPIPGSSLFNGQEIVITGSTLGEYIAALYAFMVSAIGILAATMIFYGGIKWIVAAGDRGKIQDAKETISSAIIGIVLALTAYLLLLIISPRLVKFTSLTLTPVAGIEQAFEGSEVAFGARGTPPSTASLNRDWLDKVGTGVRTQYGALITSLATAQVPEDLIYGIIYTESGGRPEVVSKAGACGIMQLLPTTAGKSCLELQNAQVGIEAGVTYLKKLASETCPSTAIRRDGSVAQCKPPAVQPTSCSNGDLYYVAAAYNGGVGANCGSIDCPNRTWWECEKNSGYKETRNYVAKVEAARTCIRHLFANPTATACPQN